MTKAEIRAMCDLNLVKALTSAAKRLQIEEGLREASPRSTALHNATVLVEDFQNEILRRLMRV